MRQEEGVWHRLDVVARSISPFFVTLLLVLVTLVPLQISDLSPIVPALACHPDASTLAVLRLLAKRPRMTSSVKVSMPQSVWWMTNHSRVPSNL